ncbi:MAG: hypothetical protein LBC75_07650 [Fibromonadaceae bacterium]|jgi:glycopeptide antibiotics resistance protein|nr:hypothetical protein [Fibromonadaceae bacterium]
MENSDSKLLVSGSGTGNPCISTAWKYAVIGAVACLVFCLGLAFFFQAIGAKYSPQTSYSSNNSYYSNNVVNTIKRVNSYYSGMDDKAAFMANIFHIAFYVTIVVGIFCVIFDLYLGSLLSKKIEATNIGVYEDKVKGVAIDKDFSMAKLIFWWMGWNKARLTSFDLAFNQITSVDLGLDHTIVINASGANYKCFVSNNSEIQTAINDKIRKG